MNEWMDGWMGGWMDTSLKPNVTLSSHLPLRHVRYNDEHEHVEQDHERNQINQFT